MRTASTTLDIEVGGKRIWVAVGMDYKLAEAKRKMREGELELNPGTTAPAAPARLTLAEQKSKFLELKNLQKKSDGTRLDRETINAYTQQVNEFLSVAAKKIYANQIDGMDLRRYMDALEKRGLTHRNNLQQLHLDRHIPEVLRCRSQKFAAAG